MSKDGLVDPRTWPADLTPGAVDLASVIRLELERARVEAAPPPPPPSPWTPTVIGTLLTTVGGIITAIIMAAVQLASSGAREDAQTRAMIRAEFEARAPAWDDVTTRLGTVEQRATWAASGVCALNGAPLHVSQPAECVATVQRDPVKVKEPYP